MTSSMNVDETPLLSDSEGDDNVGLGDAGLAGLCTSVRRKKKRDTKTSDQRRWTNHVSKEELSRWLECTSHDSLMVSMADCLTTYLCTQAKGTMDRLKVESLLDVALSLSIWNTLAVFAACLRACLVSMEANQLPFLVDYLEERGPDFKLIIAEFLNQDTNNDDNGDTGVNELIAVLKQLMKQARSKIDDTLVRGRLSLLSSKLIGFDHPSGVYSRKWRPSKKEAITMEGLERKLKDDTEMAVSSALTTLNTGYMNSTSLSPDERLFKAYWDLQTLVSDSTAIKLDLVKLDELIRRFADDFQTPVPKTLEPMPQSVSDEVLKSPAIFSHCVKGLDLRKVILTQIMVFLKDKIHGYELRKKQAKSVAPSSSASSSSSSATKTLSDQCNKDSHAPEMILTELEYTNCLKLYDFVVKSILPRLDHKFSKWLSFTLNFDEHIWHSWKNVRKAGPWKCRKRSLPIDVPDLPTVDSDHTGQIDMDPEEVESSAHDLQTRLQEWVDYLGNTRVAAKHDGSRGLPKMKRRRRLFDNYATHFVNIAPPNQSKKRSKFSSKRIKGDIDLSSPFGLMGCHPLSSLMVDDHTLLDCRVKPEEFEEFIASDESDSPDSCSLPTDQPLSSLSSDSSSSLMSASTKDVEMGNDESKRQRTKQEQWYSFVEDAACDRRQLLQRKIERLMEDYQDMLKQHGDVFDEESVQDLLLNDYRYSFELVRTIRNHFMSEVFTFAFPNPRGVGPYKHYSQRFAEKLLRWYYPNESFEILDEAKKKRKAQRKEKRLERQRLNRERKRLRNEENLRRKRRQAQATMILGSSALNSTSSSSATAAGSSSAVVGGGSGAAASSAANANGHGHPPFVNPNGMGPMGPGMAHSMHPPHRGHHGRTHHLRFGGSGGNGGYGGRGPRGGGFDPRGGYHMRHPHHQQGQGPPAHYGQQPGMMDTRTMREPSAMGRGQMAPPQQQSQNSRNHRSGYYNGTAPPQRGVPFNGGPPHTTGAGAGPSRRGFLPSPNSFDSMMIKPVIIDDSKPAVNQNGSGVSALGGGGGGRGGGSSTSSPSSRHTNTHHHQSRDARPSVVPPSISAAASSASGGSSSSSPSDDSSNSNRVVSFTSSSGLTEAEKQARRRQRFGPSAAPSSDKAVTTAGDVTNDQGSHQTTGSSPAQSTTKSISKTASSPVESAKKRGDGMVTASFVTSSAASGKVTVESAGQSRDVTSGSMSAKSADGRRRGDSSGIVLMKSHTAGEVSESSAALSTGGRPSRDARDRRDGSNHNTSNVNGSLRESRSHSGITEISTSKGDSSAGNNNNSMNNGRDSRSGGGDRRGGRGRYDSSQRDRGRHRPQSREVHSGRRDGGRRDGSGRRSYRR